MNKENRGAIIRTVPAAGALHNVPGFDPVKYLHEEADEAGKPVMRLPLAYKKLWFRLACPDGRLQLDHLRITDQLAIFDAKVFFHKDDPAPASSYTSSKTVKETPGYIRAAQEEALSTALDNAGFGIQFHDITQPLEDKAADAPPSQAPASTQETTNISTAQTKEAPAAQTKEAPAAQAKEAPAAQAKEAPAAQAKEAPAAQAKEAPAAQAKEAPAAQAKEAPAAQAEEAPATQAKEAPATQAKEAPAAQVKETPDAQVKETPDAQAKEAPAAQVKDGDSFEPLGQEAGTQIPVSPAAGAPAGIPVEIAGAQPAQAAAGPAAPQNTEAASSRTTETKAESKSPAEDKKAAGDADEDAKRKAHEEAEAKRKAEWEARQAKKKADLQEKINKLAAMSDDEAMQAAMFEGENDMENDKIIQLKKLNDRLNRCCYEYFALGETTVSDEVYDRLLAELTALEKETGVRMADSPTQNVGYSTVDGLDKTTHAIPLLSLDKTKQVDDLVSFMGDQLVMLMLKLDGLTVKLTYEDGMLMEAATRGNGDEGEIITHNAQSIAGIPDLIPCKQRLVVTGEAFIRPGDFERLKATIRDSSGKPYRNGRNLAAGSIRLFDSYECAKRCVMFRAFNVLEGFEDLAYKSQRLNKLPALGFTICKYLAANRVLTPKEIEGGIETLKKHAQDNDIPIDGIVMTYNNAAYAKNCGRTGHHYKDGLAFKFEDDLFETRLNAVEWNPTRTGEIAPVALLEPVEIDGCTVFRASLHNLSFIEGLELMPGNRGLVSKRNMIIPHVEENLDRGGFSMERLIPKSCPCCGQPTRVHVNDETKTLFCDNPACETRRLRQFIHFAGKKAMDIEPM